MTEITAKDINDVIVGMVAQSNEKLFALSQEEMMDYAWYFDLQQNDSPEWRLYQFYKALRHYESAVRRWEEHHNGHSCVVERVRDTYLMPKIKEYIELYLAQ